MRDVPGPQAPEAAGDRPGAQPGTPAEAGARSPAVTLARSGLLDLEYYAAAAGEVFPDRRSAARHCVSTGMPAGLSPNPFLSIGSLPRKIQQAWGRGHVLKVLDHLVDERSWSGPFGPLFHPGRYAERVGRSEELLEVGPLAHFLTHAERATPMPVEPRADGSVPSYGAARDALLAHARLVAAQHDNLPGRELSFHEPGLAPWRRGRPPLPMQGPGGPLVTVVTRLGGSPAAASAAVLILQGQTLHRWELIFVGDPDDAGVPDLHDGRARVVPMPADDESAATDWRNVGLAAAGGHYVAFLLPGRHWRPDFLQAAVQRLHESGHEAGHAAVSLHDPTGRAAVMVGYGDLPTLRTGGWIDVGALVCLTAAAREAGGFDPALGSGAEPEFAIQLATREPLDSFPFVASDRMVATLPRQQTSAAGADGDWLAVIGRAWVGWPDVRAGVAGREPGRVSVVIPTYNDAAMTTEAVTTLLRTTSVADVEIIVVDNGSSMALGQEMTARFVGEDRVHYRRLPVNLNFAIACNVGFAESTGEVVVFLNNDTRSDTDWLPEVVGHLTDPAVAGSQPVLLYPDGTIQTAGTVFPATNGLACHFLTGRPYLDALSAGGMRFHAATAAAMVMRAADLAELEGFDPHYVNGMEDVDLCLRAMELRPGGFRVEPRSFVTHLEGKTPGRGRRIPENRRFFMARWSGKLPGPETDKFELAGFDVVRVEDDGLEIPSPRPVIAERVPRRR
ncbi:MAG: glycosyltransferase [Nocardioides sp.]